MADSYTQVAPDSTGDKIDASELTVGADTVNRQRIVLADDSGAAALAKVTNAQPGSTDYGLAVRVAGDGFVALNAQVWAATGVLWTGVTDGFQSFEAQVSGTFSSTILFEESNDNANWTSTWFSTTTNSQLAAVSSTITNAQKIYGPIKSKYFRARVSAYTSSASGAFTLVMRNIPVPTELLNIAAIQTTVGIIPSSNSALAGTSGSVAFVKSGSSTNATLVKNGFGNIHGGLLVNNSSAIKFVKFYNSATIPTAGSGTPVAVIGISADGGSINLGNGVWAYLRFSSGIGYTITGLATDADTTAVAVNDVSGWILYA